MSDTITIDTTTDLAGRTIGRIAYGCWRFAGTSLAEARAKIGAALDMGANLIDTADVYGYGDTAFGEAEERLGDLLAADPAFRQTCVIATKGGVDIPIPYNSSKKHLHAACEASLRRLQLDSLDLYYVHRPDLLTGPEEVAEALNGLVRAGKIRAVGVSNYSPEQTRSLAHFLDVPIVAVQPEVSALTPAALLDGTLDLAQTLKAVPFAWSPLAGGMLATGRGEHPRLKPVLAALDRVAEENQVGRDAAALAWLLAHPSGMVPILGSQSPERIKKAAAAYAVRMSRRDWYAILEARLGAPMP